MTSDSRADIDANVRASFARQGLMATLGASVQSVEPGRVCLRMPFADAVSQQHGFFHGGAVAALADTAAGYAGSTTMDPDQQPLTVEFKISLIAPATGEMVEARADVVRAGRRLKFVKVDVFAIESAQETLVAVALATVAASRSVQEK